MVNNFCGAGLSPRDISGESCWELIHPSLTLVFISQGDYHIKFHLRNKNDGFQWNLITVYGAAQDEHEQSFLTEIVQCCQNESLPFLMGGDFNIIRGPNEKNNDWYDDRWPSLFNAVINSVDLKELELSGRKFTWANSLPQPTFERLDRVLVSTEWEFISTGHRSSLTT